MQFFDNESEQEIPSEDEPDLDEDTEQLHYAADIKNFKSKMPKKVSRSLFGKTEEEKEEERKPPQKYKFVFEHERIDVMFFGLETLNQLHQWRQSKVIRDDCQGCLICTNRKPNSWQNSRLWSKTGSESLTPANLYHFKINGSKTEKDRDFTNI